MNGIMTNRLRIELKQMLSDYCPDDLTVFRKILLPALFKCSECVVKIMTPLGTPFDLEIRPWVIAIGSQSACEGCKLAHRSCNGTLCSGERLFWMLCRAFRLQSYHQGAPAMVDLGSDWEVIDDEVAVRSSKCVVLLCCCCTDAVPRLG